MEDLKITRKKADKKEIREADIVADEILYEEEKDKKRLIFLLFFLFLLIFLVSYISFAVLTDIDSGGDDNVITVGSITFAYNQDGHSIAISNAYPMIDEVGKKMSGENQYFDFSISAQVPENTKLLYEISLTKGSSTLDEKYIKVYLEKNNEPVLINNKEVELFANLKDSTETENAKVLYTMIIDKNLHDNYVFKMWVADTYTFVEEFKEFRCYLNISSREIK